MIGPNLIGPEQMLRQNLLQSKFLLSNMSLKEINALSGLSRDTTSLDMAYRDPEQNPIGFDIIKLIRKYGGKADHHNEKGLM